MKQPPRIATTTTPGHSEPTVIPKAHLEGQADDRVNMPVQAVGRALDEETPCEETTAVTKIRQHVPGEWPSPSDIACGVLHLQDDSWPSKSRREKSGTTSSPREEHRAANNHTHADLVEDRKVTRNVGSSRPVPGFEGLIPKLHIFWVYAASKDKMLWSYEDIIAAIDPAERIQPDSGDQTFIKVREWLEDSRNGPWLLILDDADSAVMEQDSLWKYLPSTSLDLTEQYIEGLIRSYEELALNLSEQMPRSTREAVSFFDGALECQNEVLILRSKYYGEDSLQFVDARLQRGRINFKFAKMLPTSSVELSGHRQAKLEKAEQDQRDVLRSLTQAPCAVHPDTAGRLANAHAALARTLYEKHQFPQATEYMTKAHQGRQSFLGDASLKTLSTAVDLALCLWSDDHSRAEATWSSTLSSFKDNFGPEVVADAQRKWDSRLQPV